MRRKKSIEHKKKIPIIKDKSGKKANLLYVRIDHGLSSQLCTQLPYLTTISLRDFSIRQSFNFVSPVVRWENGKWFWKGKGNVSEIVRMVVI
jgi:hypothetical protein